MIKRIFFHEPMTYLVYELHSEFDADAMYKNIKCTEAISHYENLSMQCIEIFFTCKKLEFHQKKKFDIFLIFAQNTLEPPRRCGFNEYPQSIFLSKNKKKIGIPLQAPLFLYKCVYPGSQARFGERR